MYNAIIFNKMKLGNSTVIYYCVTYMFIAFSFQNEFICEIALELYSNDYYGIQALFSVSVKFWF